jgi:hypothetical protein
MAQFQRESELYCHRLDRAGVFPERQRIIADMTVHRATNEEKEVNLAFPGY